jgi:hypothetical protein
LQEELTPLNTPTLTNTTAGIVLPTIREEEEVQMGPHPTAEPAQKHPRVIGPETVNTTTNQAQVLKILTLKNLNHFHISYQKIVPTIGII